MKQFVQENKGTIIKAVVVLVLLVGAFATGRYTVAPKTVTLTKTETVEKIVTQTQIQYVEKKIYVTKEQKDVQTTTTVVKAPDGTETTTTTTSDKTKIDTASSQEASSQTVTVQYVDKLVEVEKLKIVEARKDWHMSLSVGGGARFIGGTVPQVVFGFQAERRIVGPFFMGLRVDAAAGAQIAAPYVAPPVTVAGSLVLGLEF